MSLGEFESLFTRVVQVLNDATHIVDMHGFYIRRECCEMTDRVPVICAQAPELVIERMSVKEAESTF